MNVVSEDAMVSQNHGEAYTISIVAGIIMLVMSLVLNIVGSTSEPIGALIQVPDGHGGLTYIPQEGYAHPYESMIPIGRVFLAMGLISLSMGVLMARQRLMRPRNRTPNLSPYLIGSEAWRVHTMIESQSQSRRTYSSRMESDSINPEIAASSNPGDYSEIQTTDSASSDSASSESCVEFPSESEVTTTQGQTTGSAVPKVLRSRVIQSDLELHLSQLKFCRDQGLLTKQEYEEKKNELMRDLHLSLVSLDGPMSFKH
jgi:hypothetical protein